MVSEQGDCVNMATFVQCCKRALSLYACPISFREQEEILST